LFKKQTKNKKNFKNQSFPPLLIEYRLQRYSRLMFNDDEHSFTQAEIIYSIIYRMKNGFSGMFYEHNMAVNGYHEFAVNCAIFKSVP